MGKKKKILLLILLLIVILAIIVSVLKNSANQQKTNTVNGTNSVNSNASQSNTVNVNSDSNATNVSTEGSDNDAGFEYNRDILDNFEFDMTIPDEIIEYIGNENDLYISVKEYVYKEKKLDEVTSAKITSYKLQESTNRLAIIIVLDNEEEIMAIINLENQKIDFYNY